MFERKIDTSMISTTSKIALKASCLDACRGDIERAAKLYDYFAADLGSLPDFEPVEPTIIEQAKKTISDTFDWLDGNQERIAGLYGLIKSMTTNGAQSTGAVGIQGVPPIPNE